MSTRAACAALSSPRNARRWDRLSITPLSTVPTRSPAKPSWVATLRRPKGRSTRPAKHTSTPRSRAAGSDATAIASRRFAGPSASGASALRMAPVNIRGTSPLWVMSSHSAVSSRVSVPWVTTKPSAPPWVAARAAAPITSQSGGASCELSRANTSTTSTSRPVVNSAPLRLGRRAPSASVVVAMVPPVAMTVTRLTLRSSRIARRARARRVSGAPLVDDGGVTDQPTGSVEPVTEADTAGEADAPQTPRRRQPLLLSIAAVVLALDIVTKVLAVKLLTPAQPVPIIGDTVTWTLVRNSGAAFSMATGYTWMLTLIASAVVVGIIWMGRRLVSPWWAVGLGMILGGAMGNLVDRFFRSPGPLRGHVVDFLSIGWWPVFNVADPSVVGGAILLVTLSALGFDFDTVGRRRADDDEQGSAIGKSEEERRRFEADDDEQGSAIGKSVADRRRFEA